MGDYLTPTREQARALQSAITQQDQARTSLIAARGPTEVEAWAARYIGATDRCYQAACEIKGVQQ